MTVIITKESANTKKRLKSAKNSNSKCKFQKHKEVARSWDRGGKHWREGFKNQECKIRTKMKHRKREKSPCISFMRKRLFLSSLNIH